LANDGHGRFDGRREDIFIGHQLADVVAVDLLMAMSTSPSPMARIRRRSHCSATTAEEA
jgi:hypothetical protein